MKKRVKPEGRLVYLDYLRGYFITVIIIDHLSRFPNAWQYITGQGLLWSSAAEGFVMLSGLMVGYVRGYKSASKKFITVARTLLFRALLLYGWMVLASLSYVALTWGLQDKRSMPWYNAPTGDWAQAFHQIVTMQLPHVWVHFLYLYAIFLLVSIPAIWLLRKDQPWIVACFSIIGYIYGVHTGTEWLRMQLLFFIPVVAGYYLPHIQNWWARLPRKKIVAGFIYATALITLGASVQSVFIAHNAELTALLAPTSLSIWRVCVASLWFMALVLLFKKITPWLQHKAFSVVHYFGTHSLAAYIAHGIVITALTILITPKDNFVISTLIGLLAILGVYVVIKLPVVRRILPR